MCLTPVTITRQIAGHSYMNNVPCNHCLECVKDKQNEYIVRTIEEQKKRGSMCFFTLTYAPENLPVTDAMEIDEETGEICDVQSGIQTLRRADVTAWFRRFRQRWKRRGVEIDFGHLVCGEYGPKTLRPHYHGIILGLTKELADDLMKDWTDNYGFVVYNFIPPILKDVQAVARYTAKYVCKNEEWNYLPDENCEKPRKMTSQFYGYPEEKRAETLRAFYTAQDVYKYDMNNPVFPDVQTQQRVVKEIIRRRKYNLGNGFSVKLPNYYKRKFFYTKTPATPSYPSVERASAIQRMVTYNVQCNADKDFKAELHNLASIYQIGEYAEVVRKYNALHDADKLFRAERYAESDRKYMVRAAI